MPLLTITASNRDRLDLNSDITKWFIKSVQWQDYTDFELLIADGGSKNYEEIKSYFENSKEKIPMRIVQLKIGELFERSKLNNVGIRNARGKYILTTDVDMIFHPHLVSTVMENLGDNRFIESRTLYIHGWNAERIYKGEIDPRNVLDMGKTGRIKKKSTAGGLQCTSIENWNRLRGFNETTIRGWGSEDVELLERVKKLGLKIRWLGESSESIMVYHQPHPKPNLKQDLECQERNKKALNNITDYRANLNVGWGGINI
jgi:glycosyltransferase involved in cell wall biosynthesis